MVLYVLKLKLFNVKSFRIKLWEAFVTSKLYFIFFCRLFLMEKIPAFKEASLNNAKF